MLIFSQCRENTNEVTAEAITGYWVVHSATRNGDVTNTLDKARFVITEDLFSCDMTGEEISQPYQLENKKITTQDKIMYTVNRSVTDTLELAFTIRNVDFEVLLLKQVDEN